MTLSDQWISWYTAYRNIFIGPTFKNSLSGLMTWHEYQTLFRAVEVRKIRNAHHRYKLAVQQPLCHTVIDCLFNFFSAIFYPWLNFGLPPHCPQVVWCH